MTSDDESFKKWWASQTHITETSTDYRAAWDAAREDLVRTLAGEWGEIEVGPTETVEDLVAHIRGAGRLLLRFVHREADWADWGNKLLGSKVSTIYSEDKLRAAITADRKGAWNGGWNARKDHEEGDEP